MTIQSMIDAITACLDNARFVTQSKLKNGVTSVLFFEKLGLRIFQGEGRTPPFMELSQNYLLPDLAAYDLPYKTKPDDYIRFFIDDPRQFARFTNSLNLAWEACCAASVEPFGCCSAFLACSDAGACIHLDHQQYYGCQYMQNLKQGRIFYGDRRNVTGGIVMEDFIAFDVETACGARCSICSIGAVRVRGGQVVDFLDLLIDPDCKFSTVNTRIHGIDSDAIQGAPTFGMAWPEIRSFFGDLPILAYNTPFDADCLAAAAQREGFDLPAYDYYDALVFARGAGLLLPNYSLDTVVAALGLNRFAHHDAAQDAEAAAMVTLSIASRFKASTLSQLHTMTTNNQHTPVKPQRSRPYASDGPRATGPILLRREDTWRGKAVCVTGDFVNFSREEVLDILERLGAVIKSGISSKVHVLIVAHADLSAVAAGTQAMTNKHAKALLQGIPIMDEHDFLAQVILP